MKKVYRLTNLGCANCAAKMERKISALKEVNDVTINFMTTKLTVDMEEENSEATIKKIQEIINKIEPDVCMRRA